MLRRIRYPRLPCCAGVAAQLFAFRPIVVTVTQFRKHNARNFSVQLNAATKQMNVGRPVNPPPTRHEQTAPKQPPARFLNGKLIPSVLFAKVLAHLETIGAKPVEENVYLPERELHRLFCGNVLPNAASLRLFDTSAENWFHHTQTDKAAEILDYVSHDYIPMTAGHSCFQPSDVKFMRREANRRGITSRIWVTTKAVERANLSLREDAVRVRLPSGFVYYSNEDTSDPDLFEKNKLPFVNQEAFRAFAPACALSGKPLSFHGQTVIQHAKDNNLPLRREETDKRVVYLSAEELWYHFNGKLLSGASRVNVIPDATPVQLPGFCQPLYHFAQTNKAKEILEYVSHDYIPTNPFRGCFKPCDAEFLRKEAKERGISSRIWVARPSLWRFGVDVAKDAKPVQVPSGFFVISAEETTDPSKFGYFGPAYTTRGKVLTIGGFPHECACQIQKDSCFDEFCDASPYWMLRKEALALGTDVVGGARGVVADRGGHSVSLYNATQLQDPSVVTKELTTRMYICRPTLEGYNSIHEAAYRRHIIYHNLCGCHFQTSTRFRHPLHIFVTSCELRHIFDGKPLCGAVPLLSSSGVERYHHSQTNKAAKLIEYVSHHYIPTRPPSLHVPFPFSPSSAQLLREIAERRNFVSRYWLTELDCVTFNAELSLGEDFVVTPDRQRVVNAQQTTNLQGITNCLFLIGRSTTALQKQLVKADLQTSRRMKFADGSAMIPESQKRAAAHVEKLRSKFPQVFSSLDDIRGEKKETIWVSKKQLETIFDYGELLPEFASEDEEEIGLRFIGQGHTRSEFIAQCERKQDLFFPHWLTTRRKDIEEYASHDYIPVVLRGSVLSRGTIATPDESEPKFHLNNPQGGRNATLLLRYVPRWGKKMLQTGTTRLKEVLLMPGYVELLPRESCELLRLLAASRKLRSPLWTTRRQIRQQGRHLRVGFKEVQEVVVYDGTIVEVFNSSDVTFGERRVVTDEFED